jgi:SAM-dependent methyltransferase
MAAENYTDTEAELATVYRPYAEALRRLQEDLSFSRIYYPGSGSDRLLEMAFADLPVLSVHLDDELTRTVGTKTSVQGDMGSSPFAEGTFDAVFMQCLHPRPDEFEELLRTLRVGGVVIYSTLECGAMDGVNLCDLVDDPRLTGMELPLQPNKYHVFEYVGHLRQ